MSSNTFKYPAVLSSIRLEKSTLTWLENNIIKIEILDKAEICKDDLLLMQQPKLELTGNQPHSVLFIMPRFGNLTKEGRDFSASPEANVNAIAKAVIAPNLGMRIVASFFISRNKPKVPHKIFLNQEDAVKWLMDQKRLYTKKQLEKVEQ